jgi:hypothetical protein
VTITVITTPIEGIDPVVNCTHKYYQIYGQVIGSETANMIMAFLTGSRMEVGLFVIDEGFDSMHIPPHGLAEDPNLAKFTGGIAVLNVTNPMKIRETTVGIGVSMMHELGHAKQCIENPPWYAGKAAQALNGSKSAKLEIENDNVGRHEKPILVELGLPFRDKYD